MSSVRNGTQCDFWHFTEGVTCKDERSHPRKQHGNRSVVGPSAANGRARGVAFLGCQYCRLAVVSASLERLRNFPETLVTENELLKTKNGWRNLKIVFLKNYSSRPSEGRIEVR